MPANTQLSRMFSHKRDPLLTFRWIASNMPFAEEYGVDSSYIETFEVPFQNVKVEGLFLGGGQNYFPGFHDQSAFNVSFYGDSGGKTLRYLLGWKSKVKNFKTGIYQLPRNYKRDWHVDLLDPAGNTVVKARLCGCWPADTNQLSLSYEDGAGRIILAQNFSLDSVEFE